MSEEKLWNRIHDLEGIISELRERENPFAEGSYTPTWTGSVANPSIGNGSIAGKWVKRDNYCTVWLSIVMGTTTTYGTGYWIFGLPFSVSSSPFMNWGMGKARDAGVGSYMRFVQIGPSGSMDTFVPADAAVVTNERLDATTPFTWGSGDRFDCVVEYPFA